MDVAALARRLRLFDYRAPSHGLDPAPAARAGPAAAHPPPRRPRLRHLDRRRGRRRGRRPQPRSPSSGSGSRPSTSTEAASTRPSRSASGARARWSSTARSATPAATAPTTTPTPRRSRRTPETPFCVYSASKAITAFVVHKLVERGQLALDDPRRQAHPRLRAQRQGAGSRSATCSPIAPACRTFRARRSPTSTCCPTATTSARPCATPSRSRRRAGCSPTTPSPAGSSSARSSTGSPARTSATVLAEEILDPLGFRWTNYGVARGGPRRGGDRLRHRPAARAAALEPADPRARACRSTSWSRRPTTRGS